MAANPSWKTGTRGKPRFCAHAPCGRELTQRQRHHGQRFCSVSCSTSAAHAEKRLVGGEARPCERCTEVFTPNRSQQKFCSKRCGVKANTFTRGQARERRATHAERHPCAIFIAQLRRQLDAEGHAGRCLFCPKPLGMSRTICARDGGPCEREYTKLWGRGRRYVAKCKAEGRPVVFEDDEPTPEVQEAVRDISESRGRLSCEMDALRARVAALARDYGVAA